MTIPDFYGECEDALKAYLQELTEFFPEEWQVSSNDTNIARGAEHFAVLRPGAFPVFAKNNTGLQVDYDWDVVLEVYVKYTEYEESWNLFKKLRAALIWSLGCNPTLKCNVQPEKSATNVWGVTLASDEAAQYFRYDDTSDEQVPNFIVQTMSVTIRQRVEFEF